VIVAAATLIVLAMKTHRPTSFFEFFIHFLYLINKFLFQINLDYYGFIIVVDRIERIDIL
jgi:hypothetical protein